MTDYHSALKPELELPEMVGYEAGGSVVFAHDIVRGGHIHFENADAIYSEPSWRDGYGKFRSRAGIEDGDYKAYLAAMRRVIVRLAVPTYMVIGKHMVRALKPAETWPIELRGYPAVLGVWNTAINVPEIDALAANLHPLLGAVTPAIVVHYVCQRHDMILDFNCGYGNLAAAALEHGKRFICSDINRKCVYYVATRYMGAAP